MLFNSNEFLLFLPLVLVAYWGMPVRLRVPVLLTASYAFYASWDWRFLGLLAGSTVIDYLCVRAMLRRERGRRRYLWISIVANLGALGAFKYFNFFLDSFRALLSSSGLGFLDGPHLYIVLPVGISFYTFQTMSFTIDAYRREIVRLPSFLSYAVYVAYFPQLVAGPIERAKHLLPQFEHPARFEARVFTSGLPLIMQGLFKKVVIADVVAAPYADRAFAAPAEQSGPFLLLGLCMFAMQIYGDFSGYSDIARGVSRLLGVELCVNFNQPYLSRNITEFWRRWHISLSSWLRDYLYIPLGGNRRGQTRTYVNLMITMLLGGLWHGASWTFVIWGGLHGVYLAIHKFMMGKSRPDLPQVVGWAAWLRAAPGIVLTNALVLLTWVFFRARDFDSAWSYVTGLLQLTLEPSAWAVCTLITAGYFALVLVIDFLPYRAGRAEFDSGWPLQLRAALYGAALTLVWIAWPTSYSPFIYFQF